MIKIDYMAQCAEIYMSFEDYKKSWTETTQYNGKTGTYVITHKAEMCGEADAIWMHTVTISTESGTIFTKESSEDPMMVWRIRFNDIDKQPLHITPIPLKLMSEAVCLALGLRKSDRREPRHMLELAMDTNDRGVDISLLETPGFGLWRKYSDTNRVGIIQTRTMLVIPHLVRIIDKEWVYTGATYAFIANNDIDVECGIVTDLIEAQREGRARVACDVKSITTMILSGWLENDILNGVHWSYWGELDS